MIPTSATVFKILKAYLEIVIYVP
eukprot:SAG31_NODE_14038_length_830_cov_1.391245_2_plen_23_part_01